MVYRQLPPSPRFVVIVMGPSALAALTRLLLREAVAAPPGRLAPPGRFAPPGHFDGARALDELHRAPEHGPGNRHAGFGDPAEELLRALGCAQPLLLDAAPTLEELLGPEAEAFLVIQLTTDHSGGGPRGPSGRN